MFIGEYYHNIDAKKRLAVPAKFRAGLGKKAVVTRGLDNCLYLYPMKEWEKLAAKLARLPITRSDSRAFVRLMLAGAMDVSLDQLGRILVPDYLKDYAGWMRQAGLRRVVCKPVAAGSVYPSTAIIGHKA